uniref:hypothetical protein n=1 Tax=Mycobacterium ulcerans TaxID=1809 RepID=UPI001E4A0669
EAMDDALETSIERLRDHLRRPHARKRNHLTENAAYTVNQTDPMICSKNLGFLIPPDSTRSAVGMLQGLGQTRDVDMRVVRTYRRP